MDKIDLHLKGNPYISMPKMINMFTKRGKKEYGFKIFYYILEKMRLKIYAHSDSKFIINERKVTPSYVIDKAVRSLWLVVESKKIGRFSNKKRRKKGNSIMRYVPMRILPGRSIYLCIKMLKEGAKKRYDYYDKKLFNFYDAFIDEVLDTFLGLDTSKSITLREEKEMHIFSGLSFVRFLKGKRRKGNIENLRFPLNIHNSDHILKKISKRNFKKTSKLKFNLQEQDSNVSHIKNN